MKRKIFLLAFIFCFSINTIGCSVFKFLGFKKRNSEYSYSTQSPTSKNFNKNVSIKKYKYLSDIATDIIQNINYILIQEGLYPKIKLNISFNKISSTYYLSIGETYILSINKNNIIYLKRVPYKTIYKYKDLIFFIVSPDGKYVTIHINNKRAKMYYKESYELKTFFSPINGELNNRNIIVSFDGVKL